MSKSQQLQIRVSASQKAKIKHKADAAEMEVSRWVLKQLLPLNEERFNLLIKDLGRTNKPSLLLAEINDFLAKLSGQELQAAIANQFVALPEFEANYLSAMVEHVCSQKSIFPPDWVFDVAPLRQPWFGSDIKNLRLYLLTQSPPAFRKRNLFVDSSIGDRV